MTARRLAHALVAVWVGLATACGGDDAPVEDPDAAAPLFPADYRDTYTMVRDCRPSASHEFHRILVWADPAAAGPYLERDAPFPVDSILLKEEFDSADVACEEEVLRRTIMKRLPAGEAPEEQLDWFWADFEPTGEVASTNDSLCWGCHDDCDGDPSVSYENTCAVP